MHRYRNRYLFSLLFNQPQNRFFEQTLVDDCRADRPEPMVLRDQDGASWLGKLGFFLAIKAPPTKQGTTQKVVWSPGTMD